MFTHFCSLLKEDQKIYSCTEQAVGKFVTMRFVRKFLVLLQDPSKFFKAKVS